MITGSVTGHEQIQSNRVCYFRFFGIFLTPKDISIQNIFDDISSSLSIEIQINILQFYELCLVFSSLDESVHFVNHLVYISERCTSVYL